jgi:predicted glycosyltransferase
MKVLIDIGHPGHVHMFRNFAYTFSDRGHQVLFTVRQKEHEVELLQSAGLPYTVIGTHYRSAPGKVWGLLYYNLRILFLSFRYRPDIYLSHGSVYTLLSSLILRIPNIALEDSGNREQVRLYLPFTSAVLTSTSFPFNYGAKQVYYNGYHELAYLHPAYFRPDREVINELGLAEGERYCIVRFVAWNASHDRNNSGMNNTQRKELVNFLSARGKVFISSEGPLPPDLEAFRFPLKPERLHHALVYAFLYAGEGATMASESAVLGTMAVYINTIRRGYLEEQERDYGLVKCFAGFEGVFEALAQLFNNPDLKSETKISQKRLINEKCDVTEFLAGFIEKWPGSLRKSS